MAGMKRKSTSSTSKSKRARTTKTMSLLNKGNIAKFERTWWQRNWSFNTTTTAGFYSNLYTNFTDMANFTEFQTLFDEVIVDKVKITFIPRYGEVAVSATNVGSTLPTSINNQFYMSIGNDPADATIPTGTYASGTYNQFCQQCFGIKTYKLDKPFSITYKPTIMAANSVSERPVPCTWMGTRLLQQPLQGKLAFIHDANFTALANNPISVDLIYTYYFRARGNRV